MEDIKKVSLITTLYNEADNILKFLESYKNQTRYADEFIIVDGGSNDDTVNIIRKYADENTELNIKIIVDDTCSKKHTAGPIAKGRNVAINNTKYDYIAVTDAGCTLDRNWFKEITRPFSQKRIDVVSGWYEANITNEFQKLYASIYLPRLEKLNLDTFLPSSRSIAFKKICWEKVGGYPTQSMTAEDTKFDLDMKKAGYIFKFTSKAKVYWNCPKNYDEALEKSTYYAFGDGSKKLFLKQFILRNIFLFFPINILLDKKRRENFKLSYNVMYKYQLGYIKGLLS